MKKIKYLCGMSTRRKDHSEILAKLGIQHLNKMQVEAHRSIQANRDNILLSPTGTGKTLAFLLPLLESLDSELHEIQALILVPARELALQIEQVMRDMGSGYKVNAVYGGRSALKDRDDLKHSPSVLIGTPGRIADHIRRENISTDYIKTLVLDEFDKSLEVGFEKEMKEIIRSMKNLDKKILTSATNLEVLPDFLHMESPKVMDFLTNKQSNQLEVKILKSPTKDKLETLVKLIGLVADGRGIIFCNYKDTINFVSNALSKHKISHGCFYGGLEQIERERALVKFRNGSDRILVATDLAARGIDIPAMDFIIHYQLPFKLEEFTHRNGRTARMHNDGVAYVLQYEGNELPDFIIGTEMEAPEPSARKVYSKWSTIFISGGRRDKISKGDIAGWFFKKGNLEKDELGVIELKQECSFVAVPSKKINKLIKELDNKHLKKRKVRVYEI